MKSKSEILAVMGELVDARMSGDQARVIDIVEGLVTGQRGDALNAVMLFAGIVAEDVTPGPEGYATVEVSKFGPDGESEPADIRDLPSHIAIFAQMVAAIASDDAPMARDLFLGYVGNQGQRALHLLVFGMDEAIHANMECPHCQGDGEAAS